MYLKLLLQCRFYGVTVQEGETMRCAQGYPAFSESCHTQPGISLIAFRGQTAPLKRRVIAAGIFLIAQGFVQFLGGYLS